MASDRHVQRARDERVGVIVVHGVGATDAGWSGDFMLPRLEFWAAHRNANGQQPEAPHAAFDPSLQRLRLRTADQDIAVILSGDPAFAQFAIAIGARALAEDPDFATDAARRLNQDALIDALETRLAKATASEVTARLAAAGIPSVATFDRVANVRAVRDPGSSKPTKTWVSYARPWQIADRDVVFFELFWADMSKVGYTIPSRFAALIQLFLESPYVLGSAFLKGPERGLMAVIRWLIQAANWIMRWPIAGLNVAVFTPALLTILFVALAPMLGVSAGTWLPAFVAGVLALTAVTGYIGYRRMLHRRVGLADLMYAGALFSFLALAALGIAYTLVAPDTLAEPERYLLFGTVALLIAWFFWSTTTVLAVIAIGLMALKRLVIRRKPGQTRLARPAAALSLSLLLGVIWKFVLALLGLFVIRLLIPDGASGSESCQQMTTVGQFVAEAVPPRCALDVVRGVLLAVTAMNAVALMLIIGAMATVIAIRVITKRVFAKQARAGRLRLPRLIASPLLVATLFIGAIINFAAFYTYIYEDFEVARTVRDAMLSLTAQSTVGAAAVGLLAFGFVMRRVVELSNSFVHVGRDLVDHQYDPDPS
ncbi:MAG: CoA transferase, partial [Pseudomonadota bacterium]